MVQPGKGRLSKIRAAPLVMGSIRELAREQIQQRVCGISSLGVMDLEHLANSPVT